MRLARRASRAFALALCGAALAAPAARPHPRDIVIAGPEPAGPLAVDASNVHALLVGVSRYDKIRPALPYCRRDVVQLSKQLLALGVKADNIVVMYDGHENPALHPTRDNIDAQLQRMCGGDKGRLKGADVWFVFTGHGTYDAKTATSYLLPQDCPSVADAPGRGLSVLAVGKRLAEVTEARARLMFIDACRTDKPNGVADADQARFVKALDQLPSDLFVYSSCSPSQASQESHLIRHGVFSASLIHALRGGAVAYTELTARRVDPSFLDIQLRDGVQKHMEWFQRVYESGLPLDKSKYRQKPTYRPDSQERGELSLFEPFAFRNSAGMTLLRLPVGDSPFGSPAGERGRAADEFPRHTIRFAPADKPVPALNIAAPARWRLYLGQAEVTQLQYEQVTGTNPSHFRVKGPGAGDLVRVDNRPADAAFVGAMPVESVTWFAAGAFCEKLTERENKELELQGKRYRVRYRLPTEEEWEYAARAGTGGPFSCGSDLTEVDQVFDPTTRRDVEQVSQLAVFDTGEPYRDAVKKYLTTKPDLATTPPKHPLPALLGRVSGPDFDYRYVTNDWGFVDMHGNVAEWTATRYDPDRKPRDRTDRWPEPVEKFRDGDRAVVRGGSWSDSAEQCRSAVRVGHPLTWRPDNNELNGGHRIGFRVACEVVFLPPP